MTETAGPSPRRITLPQLAMALPWVAAVIAAFKPITDNSFLWHVTAGEVQARAGAVLVTDPFSFTVRGQDWLTQSWLAELFYHALHQVFGLGFVGPLILFAALVFFIGLGLIVYRVSGSTLATAVVLALTTILVTPFLVPRPVLFSYGLFVLMILAWERPSTRWVIPFLMWLWASVHGSFVIGLVFMGLRLVAGREWKAVPHLLAGGIATLATAHGLGVLTMLTDFATAKPYLDFLVEWRTPSFVAPAMAPFVVGVVLLLYGAMRQRLAPRDLWVIVPFLFIAMSATRAVVTAWIALTPFVGAAMRSVRWRWGRGFALPIGLLLAVSALLLPFLFVSSPSIDGERMPVAAAGALDDVRTFHDDVSGGYLIYDQTLSDGVFLDDRAELYRGRIEEYVEIRDGRRDWETVFARDGIDQALLRAGEPLVSQLADAGWRTTYEDDHFVILRP